MYNEINVFMPDDTTSIHLTFKSYSLRSIHFCKAIAAIDDNDSSDGSGQRQWKTFWKGFTILDSMKNICDSWEEVTISTLKEVYKKLILTFMDDFEEFKISVEEVTADVIEIARELELEVEPDVVN